MSDERERVLDAMDETMDRLEDEEDVAYAEVGGVYVEKSDAVVTEDGVRTSTSFPETGVWLRVFANGAADYRYTTTLTDEAIEDEIGRAVRGGKYLAQEQPDRVDVSTLHRDVHAGWASEGVDELPLEEKLERLEGSFRRATEDIEVERVRLNYSDAHLDQSVVTSAGSSVRTVVDRAQVRTVLQPADAPKVTRHFGSTRGLGFFGEVDDHFEDVAASVRRMREAPSAALTGEYDVVLSPRAAGQLLAFAAHYLEQDVDYQGLSPHAVGDRIGPDGLTVEDTVHAGSWAAAAYDAECRPTQPVTLVRDGVVENFLHNTASAAEEGVFPAGNAVQSLGLDNPPRIHARHLDVETGDAAAEALRDDAAVYVEEFGDPWYRQEFERVQRPGFMPPSVMYAKKVDEKTIELEDVASASFPVAEGYRLEDGERGARLEGVALEYTPGTLGRVDGIGRTRETHTGVDEKHKSHLPYAVTAPSLSLRAPLVEN